MTSLAASTNSELLEFFGSLTRYREYLKQSVIRDLRTKYKRSILGYLWTMLHPLGMMLVLTVVFSHIVKFPIPDYAVFVFCGILPWNYFQSTAMMSLSSIRNNSRLFSQVPVPKYLFVLSIVVSNLINLLLSLIPLLLIMLVMGRPITAAVFALPVVLLPLVLFTAGLSLLLSALNVFFDDTLHLTEVAMQALYFLTPVLYTRELLPERLVNILVIVNPVFTQVEFFRSIFYAGVLPDAAPFLINLLGSFVWFLLCLMFFRKCEDKFLYFV